MAACQLCKKREATFHLTQIGGGKLQELHLCEKCAHTQGLLQSSMMGLVNLADSKETQSTTGASLADEDAAQAHEALVQFQKTGRFGRAEDYDALMREILPLLQKVQQATRHVGKVPRVLRQRPGLREKLERLRGELEAAVAAEHYEQAAHLRDEIRALESAEE